MFEGEGTATITTSTNRCGNVSGRCVITLTSTDPEIIDFFAQRWPPSKIGHRHAKPHHKPAFVWTLEGPRVLPFILDIRPFLRTTAERAKFDVVEEAQWLRRRGSREEWRRDRLAELTTQIRSMNRRGRSPSLAA